MLINPYALFVDSSFANTTLLLHAEDTLYDRTGHCTISITGGGAISSAQAKFGANSFDTPGTETENTNFVRATGNATDFVFSGEFTWEAWVYPRSLRSGFMNIFSNAVNFPNSGFLQLAIQSSNGNLLFNSSATGSLSAAAGMTAGAWYHIAVTRNASNVVRIFKDGVLQTSATRSGTIGSGATTFEIGRGQSTDNSDFDGWFEELRVTKACRYTANFTPPTAPFTPFP